MLADFLWVHTLARERVRCIIIQAERERLAQRLKRHSQNLSRRLDEA